MGHRDSSAQLGCHGGVFGAGGGAAGAAAPNGTIASSVKSSGAWLLLLLVRLYMVLLSPFFGGACKFYPSCSNYAYEAIARHGAGRGVVLALKRLLRCRPFTKGGFDPVPDGIAGVPEGARSPVQRAELSAEGSPSEACITARTLLPHRTTERAQ
jgi:putative membrane protein insertion efficiency factor